MAADYASLADLKKHWSKLPEDDHDEATQKLHEASIEVRGNYPDLDARIAAKAMDPEIPMLVVCRMVKRFLEPGDDDGPTAGMESVNFAAGPFTFGGKVHNPDRNVYLSAADKRLLGRSRPRKQAFTIHPGG